MRSRKVFLYISMSLDGFIATKDDDLSFLSIVEKEGEDYGYAAFSQQIDTYIVGRKTYEKVIDLIGTFPAAKDYDCYVLTRQDRTPEEGITFYSGDIVELINQIRAEEGKHIYCDGGAEIVKLFMQADLIDEYIISIIPILLGEGKRLFIGGISTQGLIHQSTKTFESGLVQLHYLRNQ